jgi:predicted phosphoribosyltransferase
MTIFTAHRARFRDRTDAGNQLAKALELYAGPSTVVLGIPRGGVPVAAQVAHALGAELDLVVARKLGAPGYPELAIGAVTANGGQYLNEPLIEELGVNRAYLDAEIARQMEDARAREERFRGGRVWHGVSGRTAVVVDDGLATGATMRAAVRSVRRQGASQLIAAVPVGATQSCAALRPEVDELVCLYELDDFLAVGYHYVHFEPVEDEEVGRIMRDAHALITREPAAITDVRGSQAADR